MVWFTIFFPYKFFKPMLAVGLLLVFEWQQISSDPLDPLEYSSWSLCCGMDGLNSSLEFKFLLYFSQPWKPFQAYQQQLASLSCSSVFFSLWQDLIICLFAFFYFHSVIQQNDRMRWRASNSDFGFLTKMKWSVSI